jgi:hypothetical protein
MIVLQVRIINFRSQQNVDQLTYANKLIEIQISHSIIQHLSAQCLGHELNAGADFIDGRPKGLNNFAIVLACILNEVEQELAEAFCNMSSKMKLANSCNNINIWDAEVV